MTRSVTDCLSRDHDRLLDLLSRLRTASRGREALANQVRVLAVSHLRAETAVVSPVVGHRGYAAVTERALRLLDRLAGGHDEAGLHADIAGLVRGHAEDVDRTLAPALLAESGAGRLEQLASAYEHRRSVEAASMRPVRPTPRRFDVSRTELYEHARRAGVPGRSTMTRDQLIVALQEASASV